MARRPANPDVDLCCYGRCPHPGRVIHDRRSAVRISNGLMHRNCHIEQTRIVTEWLTPRPGAVPWTTVCEGCREWVDGIYSVTFIGSRICIVCAAKSGDATAQGSLTRQGRWDPDRRCVIDPPPPPPPPLPPPPPPSFSSSPAICRTGATGSPDPAPSRSYATVNTLDDLD